MNRLSRSRAVRTEFAWPCPWLPGSSTHEGVQGLDPEQAALKTLYLVTRSMDPKGIGQARWVTRWKPALNAFADRMPPAENL